MNEEVTRDKGQVEGVLSKGIESLPAVRQV